MTRLFRSGLSVSGPFVRRCLIIQTMPRFHIPLIEPDMVLVACRSEFVTTNPAGWI